MKTLQGALLALVLLFSILGSSARADINPDLGYLPTLLQSQEDDGGGMVLLRGTAVSRDFLRNVSLSGAPVGDGPSLVLTGKLASDFANALASEGEGDLVSDYREGQMLVLKGSIVEILEKLLKKHLEGYKGLLEKEVTFILNSLKRSLTYELVKAIINGKVRIHMLLVVPFAYLIDQAKLLLGTAGLIITAAAGGALVLLEYAALALAKVLKATGQFLGALIRAIIDRFKKDYIQTRNDLIASVEEAMGWRLFRPETDPRTKTLHFSFN